MKHFSYLRVFLTITAAFISTSSVSCLEKLKDHGIYSFLNRHDEQFLTAINLKIPNPIIVLDDWRGASTQKWRADSAYTVTAYQLKPTSDEARVMNIDWNSGGNFVVQDSEGFGLSSSQYWQVKSAGDGFSQIRNYQSGNCLQSFGKGKQVGLGECDNSFRQQWQIRLL